MMFLEPANFNRLSRMYDLIVNISWEAPSNPRGVILAYSYCLVATCDSGDVIIEYTNTTLLSVQRSVIVSPFTNYTATVVAFPSVGGGDSVMDVALSPEAGKFTFINNCTSLGFLEGEMSPWLDRLSTALVYQASLSLTLQKFLQGERWADLIDFTSSPSSTAPSPVQNLMVGFLSDSATYNTSTRIYGISVNISWQSPQYPNGEIIAYSYRLMADGDYCS